MITLSRRHEGNPWKVWATHENGTKMVRVTDGRGVRLMVECGYTIDKVEEQKPEYPNG